MRDQTPRLRRPSRLRLVDDVCRSLQEAILSGRVRPGERLVETTIAAELAVSRTTVREALLMLEHQGLVVNVPRRGAFVTRLSADEAYDLKITRALLEAFALRLGRERFDEELFDDLAGLLAEMRSCTLPDEFPRLVRTDLAFHRRLVETAGSRRVLNLWGALDGQIGALMLRSVENNQGTADSIAALHEELLDAVRSGDPHHLQATVIEHYAGNEELSPNGLREMTEVIDAVVNRTISVPRPLRADAAGMDGPPRQAHAADGRGDRTIGKREVHERQ